MTKPLVALAALLAVASGAYAQRDKHDSKHNTQVHKPGPMDEHGHSRHTNTTVLKHPLVFHSHVPPPGHRPAKFHKPRKVWMPPHWDKHHKHLIKGYWVWKR